MHRYLYLVALSLLGCLSACQKSAELAGSANSLVMVADSSPVPTQAVEAPPTNTLPAPVLTVVDLPTNTPTITLTPSITPTPTETPLPSQTPTETPEPPDFAWLNILNSYRIESGLEPVGYDFQLSADSSEHAEYMGRNDDSSARSQVVGAPYYTGKGSQAAINSIVFSIDSPDGTDLWAFDYWMSAPFHAVTLLDPDLKRVGYGRFRDDFGGVQIAYVLDSLREAG